MKVNPDVAVMFVVIIAVISAVFVGIMSISGMEAAAPWGLGFAAAYVLFKRPSRNG